MSGIKESFKAPSALLANNVYLAFLQISQVVVLARLLGPSEYASLAVILSINAIYLIVTEFGISNCIVSFNDWSSTKLAELSKNYHYYKRISYLIFLVVALLSLYIFNIRIDIFFSLVMVITSSLLINHTKIKYALILKSKRYLEIVYVESTSKTLGFLTCVILLILEVGVIAIGVSMLISSAAALIQYKRLRQDQYFELTEAAQSYLSIEEEKSFCKFSTIDSLQSSLGNQIDIFIVNIFLDANSAGAYAFYKTLAFKVFQLLNPVAVRFFMPIMSGFISTEYQNRHKKYILPYILFISFCYLIFEFTGSKVISLVGGSQWIDQLELLTGILVFAYCRSIVSILGVDVVLMKAVRMNLIYNLCYIIAFSLFLVLFLHSPSSEISFSAALAAFSATNLMLYIGYVTQFIIKAPFRYQLSLLAVPAVIILLMWF